MPITKDHIWSTIPVDSEAKYGEASRLKKVKNPRLANATMHNILREYFAEFSPFAPNVEGRITATDAPQALLS